MKNTKAIGECAEAMVMAALLRARKVVLRPFGESQRYDLVIEENGVFSRVQCKAGRYRDGAVEFRATSNHYHRGGRARRYAGEVEYFGVYCSELNKCYLVPIAEVGTCGYLRVLPARSGRKKVKPAQRYEIMPS